MAQFFNDFSQYPLGQFPDDWTAFVNDGTVSPGADNGTGIGDERHLSVVDLSTEGVGTGKGVKFDAGDQAGSNQRLYLWDLPGVGADFEVVYRFLLPVSTAELQAALRADPVSGSWYQLGPRSGDDLDINKYVNGSFSNLANNTVQDWIDEGNWQWCRARVNGTNLYIKVWSDGDLEPESWDVVDTDTSLATGKAGFVIYRDPVNYLADFGIGTNGDPAPTGPVGGGDDLLADDIQSTSETGTPLISQTHNLTSVGTESVTSVSSPTITQTHALSADSIDSSSELTDPSLDSASTVDSLSAEDVSSASETGSPSIQQTHNLKSVSVSSLSTISSPTLTSVAGTDNLAANDVECKSETGTPALSQTHALQPDSVQSASEISTPAIGQIHVITATGISSASEVTSPVLRDASQVLKTPIKNTKATVVQTTYRAAIIQTVYKAEVA